MPKPNFSESQLQIAVNSAIMQYVFDTFGKQILANVPSLNAERYLGWDSAFYFPWFPYVRAAEHEGCNFFIQYKLSKLLTTKSAKHWHYWDAEHFRFEIPYRTKEGDRFFDDYHQWELLKMLANNGYPTFYVTNDTHSKNELFNKYENGTLLKTTPMLDVRDIHNKHKYITFTNTSNYFLLHSQKEEIKKLFFSDALKIIDETQAINLKEANKFLLKTLRAINEKDSFWQNELIQISELHISSEPHGEWMKRSLLAAFIRKHIGAEMLWLSV